MNKSIFTSLTFIFALTFSVSAQKITVQLSKDTLLLGNSVKLSFEIQDAKGDFTAPDLTDLNVVSGPNVSSSYQIINGISSSKESYTYIVKPEHDGAFLIKPAYLVTEDSTIESSPLELLVLPNPDGIIEEDPSFSNGFFDFDPFDMNGLNLDNLEIEPSEIAPFDLDFPSFLFRGREQKKDTTQSKYKLRRI